MFVWPFFKALICPFSKIAISGALLWNNSLLDEVLEIEIISNIESLFEFCKGEKEDFAISLGIQLNEYQNSFIKLVDIQDQKDQENSISLELIKAILILRIV